MKVGLFGNELSTVFTLLCFVRAPWLASGVQVCSWDMHAGERIQADARATYSVAFRLGYLIVNGAA